MELALESALNTDRKGENNSSQHFLIFHNAVNPLPDDKVLGWSKLKAFADDKIKVTEKLKFVLRRAEHIVGKGKNAGY